MGSSHGATLQVAYKVSTLEARQSINQSNNLFILQRAKKSCHLSIFMRESLCRDITGRLTMQTSLGLPEDPII